MDQGRGLIVQLAAPRAVQIERHGHDPHQRSVAAGLLAPAAALLQLGAVAKLVHGLADRTAHIKGETASRVFGAPHPVHIAAHLILRIETSACQRVHQRQRHAGVIRPCAGLLAVEAAAPHSCDGILLPDRAVIELHRYAQSIANGDAQHRASDHLVQIHAQLSFPSRCSLYATASRSTSGSNPKSR